MSEFNEREEKNTGFEGALRPADSQSLELVHLLSEVRILYIVRVDDLSSVNSSQRDKEGSCRYTR